MVLPLPPLEFQQLVCGPSGAHLFEEVGRWVTAFLDHERLLEARTMFLDVGCGCGRIARELVKKPLASYVGFDRHPGMVAWAQQAISSADPRFQFHFVPVQSVYTAWDQHSGTLSAESFMFPCSDASVDTALLASVFTHMRPNEVSHYLGELARVVRPGGGVLLSIFFSDGEDRSHDAINVFHDRSQFLADLDRLPFLTREVLQRFVTGRPFDPRSSGSSNDGGYTHHWFRLTRANA